MREREVAVENGELEGKYDASKSARKIFFN